MFVISIVLSFGAYVFDRAADITEEDIVTSKTDIKSKIESAIDTLSKLDGFSTDVG